MKITKYGYGIIIGSFFISILLWIANDFYASTAMESSAILLTLFTLFCVNFFRDPDAKGDFKETDILSPAQGKVVQILDIDHDDFIGGPAVKISIFLSVFNVHVNSHPITGIIKVCKHQTGKMLAAFNPMASEENEQTVFGIEGKHGNIIHKQITGLIARRIIFTTTEGENVEQGDRFGMIRFGSRCDVIMSTSAKLNVKLGDKVERGETVIGEFVG